MGTPLREQPHQLMTPERAERLAAKLNADADGWTYEARHDPTGRGLSYIVIYDEVGERIGDL